MFTGAVDSPKLLLLSGIGPREELRKVNIAPVHDLPGVGKNLHNHVAHFLNFMINDTDTTALNWATAMEYLLFRDGLMSGTGLSEVTGFVNSRLSNPADDNPDLQLFFSGYLANCARTGQVGERSDGGNSSSPTPQRSISLFPTVLHPKSRGFLTLKDNNPKTPPLIFGRYLTHPDDVKTLVDGIKIAIRLTQTAALQKYGFRIDTTPVQGCEDLPFGCDAYWECAVRRNTGAENHQAGSCKMGPDTDPSAVVSPDLKVHGVDRLRVVDCSIMPAVTSGNTNAPAIMIAEKASDLIKQRWVGKRAWNKW